MEIGGSDEEERRWLAEEGSEAKWGPRLTEEAARESSALLRWRTARGRRGPMLRAAPIGFNGYLIDLVWFGLDWIGAIQPPYSYYSYSILFHASHASIYSNLMPPFLRRYHQSPYRLSVPQIPSLILISTMYHQIKVPS